MTERAPVSVVIPAYNSEDYIREAIESVLVQTLPVSEIIVVDDGSSDRTSEIAKSLGALVMRQSNRGVSAARNVGIRAATQEWIAFLDADDIWEPQKIEYQLAATRLHPDVGMVSCHLTWFEGERVKDRSPRTTDSDLQSDGGGGISVDASSSYFPRASLDLLVNQMNYYPSTKLIRRDLLLSVGLFDESLLYNGDFECFLRVLTRCALVTIEAALVQYRLHPQNSSKDTLQMGLAHIKVVDRLRAQPKKYPPGAAQAFDNKDLGRVFIVSGRLLLDQGRMCEARGLFCRSIGRIYSARAMFLWCLTFLSPSIFKHLLTIKRKLL